MLDALHGNTPDSAPNDYVRNLFDHYAPHFDRHLVDVLRYDIPARLALALQDHATCSTRWKALDLGCGTGLLGPEIRVRCEHLEGVDLSPAMLEFAAARGVYDRLIVADLTQFMAGADAHGYDLACACDVFVYLGDLAPVFVEVHRILRPAGVFAFSVEMLHDGHHDYAITAGARFAHSAAYISRLAREAGFRELVCQPVTVRTEKSVPLEGRIYVLAK